MENTGKNLILKLMLSQMQFLSLRQKIFMEDFLKDERELLKMSLDDISIALKDVKKARSWNPEKLLSEAKKSFAIMEKLNLKAVHYKDDDFPPLLREMSDSPYMIFYRGNLDALKKNCVSVVGTRRATPSGKKAALSFSKAACDKGFCVVSGLAFGIDGFSHKGALESEKASTCAVLPSGIDTIVPESHKNLASKILENNGLILSEYIPGSPAMGFRCVHRDRIIAALSPSTVVIQSPPGSGALITAKCALDYNRELFFHSVSVNEESKTLDEYVKNELMAKINEGKPVDYKLDSRVEKYLAEGAPLIDSFEDFINKAGIVTE